MNFQITNRAFVLILLITTMICAQNPIVPNKGLNDPHIHIFNDTAYVYASHDTSIENKKFVMEDWWIWSSPDLVSWKKESVLKPEDTYIGKPFTSCWATDVAHRNGKYYWYFSEGNQQTGVVVSDSPTGPWKDVLGKPLLTSGLTPTDEYDMAILEDNGEHYIIFGVWDYYIAKLNENMISLAEKPKKIEIKNPRGPYNLDGKNTEKPTDDKPFMHKLNGKYYLSWGVFYGISDNPYGPFDFKSSILNKESFAEGYDKPTWPTGFQQGRHGSFFEWHNQTYFAYCDMSQTGNRYFRDTFISYVHYKENGEMAKIRVDGIGVGNYDANQGKIEAEDYFKAEGISKKETINGVFVLNNISKNDFLVYPNIKGLSNKNKISFTVNVYKKTKVEIRENSPKGKLLQKICLVVSDTKNQEFKIKDLSKVKNLCFVFKGKKENALELDSFQFLK